MAPRPATEAVLQRISHPPVRETGFWLVQAAVAVIAAVHLLTDLRSSVETSAFPAGLPVALLVVPVGYAALRWGLAGSAVTGLWATVLWLPDLLLPPDQGHLGGDLVDLALIATVACVVGWQIDLERAARARVERATEARAAAERRAMRYASQVVEAEEDQRRRIARELHDEPLQLFLYVARRLGSLGATAGVPAGVTSELDEIRAQVLDGAARLRATARGLRPPALDQLGLVAALSSLIDEADGSGVRAELQVSGEPVRLPSEVELGAFRIAQEAVRNALRHAAARRLGVTVAFGDDAVILDIVDDGRGFDPAMVDAGTNGHLGVLGMTERARLLGGEFDVVTSPAHGTAVHATLPLSP